MRLLLYDSFILLRCNQINDLRISEFERSCVRAETKHFRPHLQVLQMMGLELVTLRLQTECSNH